MKRFFEIVFSVKANACLSFTAMMIICTLIELIWGVPLVTPWRVIQYVALSAITGLLQYICFGGRMLEKASYFVRAAIFLPVLLVVLTAFALVFRWFPTGELAAWGIFFGIALVIFLGLLAGFEVMFRVTGRRYTTLLGEKQGQK